MNNKFNIKMFDNTKNISQQIKLYLDEINYINEEIKYWNIENDLTPSENKRKIIVKLNEELVKVQYDYSNFLIENNINNS